MMQFAFIKQRQLHFTFPAVAQFSGIYPFIMEQQLAFCSQANHIILVHGIQFQKHLVIIIAAVHNKSCFSKQSGYAFHGGESYCVDRSKIFLFRGMDFGENTDWMITVGEDSGFSHMVSFFINVLSCGAFRTITHISEGFKFVAIRFHNITVIDMDNGMVGTPLFDQ